MLSEDLRKIVKRVELEEPDRIEFTDDGYLWLSWNDDGMILDVSV